MYEGLARWIFDFRPQILGVLSALTLYAVFVAVRITPSPMLASYPPADPAIRSASAIYDNSFPASRALSFYVEAQGRARLDSAQGESWLRGLGDLLAGLPDRSGRRGILQEGETAALRRMDPDGRAAILTAQLRPDAVPDLSHLSERLAALAGPGGGSGFRAVLLEPPPPTGLGPVMAYWVPEAVGVLLLAAGLLAYSASFVLTGLALFAALLAIVWQTALWSLFGGSFEAGQRFIAPFIVTLVLGHSFPMARYIMRGLIAGVSPAMAAMSVVRRVAPAGAPALIAVGLALLAGALIPVPATREALLFAALGVFLVVPALFVVMPLLLSQVRVDRPPAEALPEPRRPRRPRPELSLRQAAAGPQTVAILVLALALIAGLEARAQLFGPVDAAGLSASADPSWIHTANAAAAGPGEERASVAVLARTTPQSCTRFEVLDAVDRLSWQIANIPGVSAVDSLPLTLRGINASDHGGDLRWRELPREPVGALQDMVKVPHSAALFDRQCRTLTIKVYARPPIAAVLRRVDQAVEQFNRANTANMVSFSLGGGPLANALSDQRLLERHQTGTLIAIIAALVVAAFFGVGDWRAAGAMLLMSGALILACGWAVAAIPLGLTGRSTPFVLLALVLSADMAIYVVMGWRTASHAGVDPDPRRRLWQRDGRALLSRSLAICVSFSVWIVASDPLQRHLGMLVIVTTLVAMMTALFVIPAASMLAERGFSRRSMTAD